MSLSSDMSSVLRVSDLSKVYTAQNKSITALSRIDISVNSGEFVAIIGPNGSGKSTLLKIIAGILPPSTAAVADWPSEQSYLPQGNSLLPWRTVEENLYLEADVKNISREKIKSRAEKLLKEFGLLEFASLYPSSLSGGMQQKLALIRSVLYNPSLLLLDEPFAALDALTRIEAQQWLLRLWQKNKPSVILVTHDVKEAVFLADTIYVLSSRPGKIKKKFTVDKKQSDKLEKQLFSLLVNNK